MTFRTDPLSEVEPTRLPESVQSPSVLPAGVGARADAAPWNVEALYRRFGPMVLRRCRRFLASGDAEEVAHEVFVKAIESAQGFRGESSPATWLFRVATRLSLNHLRDRRRHGALLARNAPTVFSESALASDPDARVFLKSLWRTLPEELALIGVHYYIDGLTTAEIGRMLGVSDRTVATRLRTLEQSARREAGEEPGP
jgi:RNA polymerase sigma-70 factor (ECF subfamily)